MSGIDPHRRLAICYERGVHLATIEKNRDYAHVMFAECMLINPGNLQFVDAMLQNLKARSPKTKKSFSFRISGSGYRALRKAFQCKQWPEVFRLGADLLKADAWDATTLCIMAEACAALHYNEVELAYLKQALDADPRNLEVNRHCARSLRRMGQFDQAIACWHRVEQLAGKDAEAARAISWLAEEKLKYPGGRPPAASVKQVLAVEPQATQAPREISLSPRQKLERAIAEDPQNVEAYLQLADLLLKSDQFDAANAVLTRGIAACGDQPAFAEYAEQVCRLRAERCGGTDEAHGANEKQMSKSSRRVPWIEVVLVIAGFGLLLQLSPTVAAATRRVVNVRNWSRLGWIIFNILVLLGLFAIRFAADIRALRQQRPSRRKERIASSKAGVNSSAARKGV